jgi:hypothetical protein
LICEFLIIEKKRINQKSITQNCANGAIIQNSKFNIAAEPQ